MKKDNEGVRETQRERGWTKKECRFGLLTRRVV